MVVYQSDLSLSFAGGLGDHPGPTASRSMEPEVVALLARNETRPQGCSLEPQIKLASR